MARRLKTKSRSGTAKKVTRPPAKKPSARRPSVRKKSARTATGKASSRPRKFTSTEARRGRRARGFAAMSEEKQRQIASQGGRAAHAQGTAHEFTPQEAKAAGHKGGQVISRDRRHMALIGRRGGES